MIHRHKIPWFQTTGPLEIPWKPSCRARWDPPLLRSRSTPKTSETTSETTAVGEVHIWLMVEPYPSEKYEFVSWDDDIPNMMEKIKNVPNHQPDRYIYIYCIIQGFNLGLYK